MTNRGGEEFLRIGIIFLMVVFVLSPGLNPLAQPLISLDFKDADIRDILKFVAEAAEINIVIGDEVKGKITIKLVDVSWNQALEVILQSQSLGMVKTGNVIRIATLEKLRKEEETQLTSKRAKEKIENLRIEMIHLKYAIAKDMVPLVKTFLSDRGSVTADERTNTLVVRDVSENIETIKSLFR